MQSGNSPKLYSCRNCGSKFSPEHTGGICPYCKSTSQELIHHQRINHRRKQIRKKQLRTAAIRLSAVLVAVIALIIGAAVFINNVLHSNESLVFDTENNGASPLFYTDIEQKVYYINSKNAPLLIGKGEVVSFAYTQKSNTVYFVFKGTRDVESSGSEYMLMRISGNTTELIASTPYGTISFAEGGNCQYIYYLLSEELSTYQSSAKLFIYDSQKKSIKKIEEYSSVGEFSNFKSSPNGRYLLYKAADGDGTKLMKYSVKNSSSEALGIKNAEPVSIDNKGKYYSYLRTGAEGFAEFYVESGITDREKTVLESHFADRILVSSESTSFVIETGNLTTVKTVGSEAAVIATRTGSGISPDIIPSKVINDNNPLVPTLVHTIARCTNKDFFPYYYLCDTGNYLELMCCTKDGAKNKLTDAAITNYCTNGTKMAYIFQNSLYTMSVDLKNSATTLVSENFTDYTLEQMSADGKFVFYSDKDGNLYRIPFKFNGAELVKLAVDAHPYITSKNGKKAVYIADKVLLHSKDTQPSKVCGDIIPEHCYAVDDCSKIYCIAPCAATGAYSLYVFDGKKVTLIADNAIKVTAAEYLSVTYDDTPFSTYVPATTTDVSTQTDAMADANITGAEGLQNAQAS